MLQSRILVILLCALCYNNAGTTRLDSALNGLDPGAEELLPAEQNDSSVLSLVPTHTSRKLTMPRAAKKYHNYVPLRLSIAQSVARRRFRRSKSGQFMDAADFHAFSNTIPKPMSASTGDPIFSTILKIVDHKFDTLSARISAMERAVNGLQYYSVGQFRLVKMHSVSLDQGVRNIESRVTGLEREFNRADFVGIRHNSQTTKYDVKTLAKSVNGMFDIILKKIDKFNYSALKENSKHTYLVEGNEERYNTSETSTTQHTVVDKLDELTTIANAFKAHVDNATIEKKVNTTATSWKPTTTDHSTGISEYETSTKEGNVPRVTGQVKVQKTPEYWKQDPSVIIYSKDTKEDRGPIEYESLKAHSDIKNSTEIPSVTYNSNKYEALEAVIGEKLSSIETKIENLTSSLDDIIHIMNSSNNKENSNDPHGTQDFIGMLRQLINSDVRISDGLRNQSHLLGKLIAVRKSSERKHDSVRASVEIFRNSQNILMSKTDRSASKIESLTSMVESYEVNQEQLSADLYALLKSVRGLESASTRNLVILSKAITANQIIENVKIGEMKRLSSDLEKTRHNVTNVVGLVTDLTQISKESLTTAISDLRSVVSKLDKKSTLRSNCIREREISKCIFGKEQYNKLANISHATLTLVEAISANTGWMPYVLDLVEKIYDNNTKTADSLGKMLEALKINSAYQRSPTSTKIRSRRHHSPSLSGTLRKKKGYSNAKIPAYDYDGDQHLGGVLREVRRILPSVRRRLLQSGTLISLENGTRDNEGRVAIYHNGVWGALCDVTLGSEAANSVCRALGYPGGTVASRGAFGIGSGPVWHVQSKCLGEHRIDTDRCLTNGIETNSCSRSQAFSVRCEHQIRLSGYTVEVYHDHTWGSVCSDNWSINEAMVSCRQLRHNRGVPRNIAMIDESTGPVWLSYVKCYGDELRLDQCRHSEWKRHVCSSGILAGVACFNN